MIENLPPESVAGLHRLRLPGILTEAKGLPTVLEALAGCR